MGIGPEYALTLLLGILAARPLTVALHETAHALTALLLFRSPVTMFWGTLGSRSRSRQWLAQLGGKFSLWVSWHHLWLPTGLTEVHLDRVPGGWWRVAVAGPLMSLLLAGTCLWLALSNWGSDAWWRLPLLCMGLSAALDLYRALFRRHEPVVLASGRAAFSDGETIWLALRLRQHLDGYLRALYHWEMDDYAACIRELRPVVAFAPRMREAQEMMVFSHLALGDLAQMEAALAGLRAHCPAETIDFVWISELQLRRGEAEAALASLNEGLRLAPGHATGLSHRAFLKIRQGDLAGAQADLEFALRADKEHAAAWNHLAHVAMEAGDLEEAEAALEKSQEFDPVNPLFLYNRARFLHEKGEFEQAKKGRILALMLDPSLTDSGYIPLSQNT